MAKISIKTDFKDGDKLPASDLNNNFKVIQEGVNANETNLESVIVEAEERLQKELEQITADRGWDWGGSSPDRATFYKNGTEQVNSKEIVNGQTLVNVETGEMFLDDNGKRISVGSGNVVQVGGEKPTNKATKIWFDTNIVNSKASEVIDSVQGNETDLSPSVRSIKKYVDDAVFSGITDSGWIDAILTDNFVVYSTAYKPLYRKIGNMVEITGVVKPKSQISAGSTTIPIFYLPEGYRPNRNRYMVCQGSGSNKWLLTIIADTGAVTCARYGTTEYIDIPTTAWLPFNITFFVEEVSE